MRRRVVLGSLLFACALGVGAWLVARHGSGAPGLEADAPAADEVARDGSADGLAAHLRPSVVGPVAKAARGRIEGDVRRGGAGVAARVMLFEAWRTDRGADPKWSNLGSKSRVPTEESLAAAPVVGIDADGAGRFAFDDVPAGTYDAVARSAEGGYAAARVSVACDRALATVHLELRGGGPARLSGRVHHADGRPFRGFVAPGTDDTFFVPHAAPQVALDDDGRFTLTGLDPGPVCVIAYAPGSLFVRSHVVVVPSASELDLVVDAGLEEAKGRVVADKDGQAVAGAVVLTTFWEGIGAAVVQARAVTDAEGRFRVPAMRGVTQYRIEAPAFAPLETGRWFAEGDGLEFRLERVGKVVGRVTSKSDGAPVEGVTVYVVDGEGEAGPHAVTKPDGRYEVADVVPGDVVVVAYGGGWLSDGFARANAGYNPFAVPLEAGTIATVDLVVTRGAGATGVVLDAGGKPVAGASVRPVRKLPGGAEDQVFAFLSGAQRVATGADGRFVVETLVSGASYEFVASAPNASDATAGPLRTESEKPIEVEIRLGAARFADVVVRESGGGPIAGVTVYAATTSDENDWRQYASGSTGASGVVRLGPLPPGPIAFGTWTNDGFGGEDVTEGGPDGSTDPIRAELVVDRRHAISGTVRYVDGTPFDSGAICLLSAGDVTDNAWLGRNGTFRLTGVAPGSYELQVKLDWSSEPALTVPVKAGDENLALVVKSPRAERLDVAVLDAAGRPAGRGSFRIKGVDGQSDDGSFEEGRFHVGVRTGEWSMLVYGVRSSSGGPAGSGSIVAGPFPPAARFQEIRLPPERPIEGVVRAPDGHGVRGVRVGAWFVGLAPPFADVDDEVCGCRTDEKGRFRLGGLADGTYRLRVAVGGGYGAIEPVEVAAGRTDVVLTLKVGDAVSPLVLDADGKPIVGVYLVASCPGTDSVSETDGEGRATLEGLDAGRAYRLSVHVPSSRTDVLSRTLEEWMPTSEPIVLPRGHRIAGVVRDVDGRPVAGASVDAQLPGGDTLGGSSTGNGTFELLRVPEGPVTLRATADGDELRRSRPVETIAGAADVVIVLERTANLAVRLAASRPLPDECVVRVHAESGGDSDWERTQGDHVAFFRHLQPSVLHTFFATVEVDGVHLAGIAKGVRGDAKTLTLDLAEGRSVSGRVRYPPGTTDVGVWATFEGEGVVASLEEDGRFVIHGLLDGPCVVRASGVGPGGERLSASANTEAGGAVELDLRPQK